MSYFLFGFLEGGRAVVYAVGGSVDLTPPLLLALKDVDIVLLFGDILDAAEHEDILVEAEHGVPSPPLPYYQLTYGFYLLTIFSHFLYFKLNFQKSFRVCFPFDPPNSQISPS